MIVAQVPRAWDRSRDVSCCLQEQIQNSVGSYQEIIPDTIPVVCFVLLWHPTVFKGATLGLTCFGQSQ